MKAKIDNVPLVLWIDGKVRIVSLPAGVIRTLRMVAGMERKSVEELCVDALVDGEAAPARLDDAARIQAAVMRHLAFGARAGDGSNRLLSEPIHH